MRTRTGLVYALLLSLSLAGCGTAGGDGVATAGGGGKPKSGASSGPNDKGQVLAFARCMRKNGVPDFPDPETDEDGGIQLRMPRGTSKEKVDAAMKKCKEYLPNGGEPKRPNPEQLEAMRKYSKCMRENGVPNFPDPNPNGGMQLDGEKLGMSPDDPRFKAAEKKCEKHQPNGPGRRMERRAG